MVPILERAFAEAAKLSEAEQELLGARWLAELEAEEAFDRAIAASAGKLKKLAQEAIDEYRAGQTQPLDLDEREIYT